MPCQWGSGSTTFTGRKPTHRPRLAASILVYVTQTNSKNSCQLFSHLWWTILKSRAATRWQNGMQAFKGKTAIKAGDGQRKFILHWHFSISQVSTTKLPSIPTSPGWWWLRWQSQKRETRSKYSLWTVWMSGKSRDKMANPKSFDADNARMIKIIIMQTPKGCPREKIQRYKDT